jgi:hypothetical protein
MIRRVATVMLIAALITLAGTSAAQAGALWAQGGAVGAKAAALPAKAAAVPAKAAPAATIDVLFTTIVARGAAVDVAFGITCPEGFTGTATVSLAQVRNSDGLHAQGSAVTDVTCSGTGLLYMQRVTADITGAPFARGKATLAMQVVACDDQTCFSTPLNRTTKITA